LSKGQVFEADFVNSVALFSFFLVFFGVLWNSTIDEATNTKEFEQTKKDYSFMILRSPGIPQNWSSTTVDKPGIYSDGKLNRTKFLELKSLSEERIIFFLRSESFQVKIEYLNGTLLSEQGKKLLINSSQIPQNKSVRTDRALLLDEKTNKRTKLSLFRWD